MAKEEKDSKKNNEVKPIKKGSSKKKTTKKSSTGKTTNTKKVEKKSTAKEKVETKVIIEEKKILEEVSKAENKDSNIKSFIELILIIIAVIVILVFFEKTVAWNIVVVLLILSVLIFVHELGHYIIGKKCGVHIYEFALGMGPKVLGFKRKNDPTEYTLRAFPIGGFCQLAGEEGEDDDNLPKDKFMCNKTKLQRVAILIAGVTMNIITAIVLFFMVSLIWGSTPLDSYIHGVIEGSSAQRAGIEVGDRIIKLNGHKVSTWDKLQIVSLLKNEKETYEYVIEKEDGSVKEFKIKPDDYIVIEDKYIMLTDDYTKKDVIRDYNLDEDKVEVVKLIGVEGTAKRDKSFGNAIEYAFKKVGTTVDTMFLIIGSLITGNLGLDSLSGPVGMYKVVEEVAVFGIANIIYLMAYLSVNLAVVNILPFPAFDGGRVFFILIEKIRGKKLDPKFEAMLNNIGFFLLLALMLYITFQDILLLLGK